MKICLVAHGYPPELVGGTEKSVQALARGLARRGHAVSVVAGSMQHEEGFRVSEDEDRDPVSGDAIRVHRIHRADLYFDHWQKSASSRVSAAFRAFLSEEKPDVVHVNHWIRLTRDLVQAAARENIPAVVTLHDLWSSCLVTFRVRPDTQAFCEAPLAINPCLSCAGGLPPKTPWVPFESQAMELGERRADLKRELTLARAVIAPSRSHADAVARFLDLGEGNMHLCVVPNGRHLDLEPRTPLPSPTAFGRLILGAWGHFHPLKGLDLLIEAVRLLENVPITLRLAGGEVDAGYAARLREQAEGLDVEFAGPFQESELSRLPATDVHLMLSGTRALESWGLILDEAASLRVPMVLPRSGAFPERFDEGAGVLFFDPGSAESLAACLLRAWEDPDLVAALRSSLPACEDVVPGMEQHLDGVFAAYTEAVEAGAPAIAAEEWWAARMQQNKEAEWDASLRAASAEELGFA